MARKSLVCLMITLLLILSGCWGQRDIENLGFVIGAAVDLEEDRESGEYQFKLTNQTVLPPLVGTPGQGKIEGVATKNNTASGKTMLIATEKIDAIAARVPFYEHLKILVISKDTVSQPNLFPKIMDYFLREGEMRREIRVLIADGKADRILEVQPEGAQMPAMFIESAFENTEKSSLEILNGSRAGDIHELLLSQFSYPVPLIESTGTEVRIDRAVVFESGTDSVVGTIEKDDLKGLNFIIGNQTEGVIEFEIEGEPMVLQMREMQSEINMDASDIENVKIGVHIEVEGIIDEMFSGKTLMDTTYLAEIEKKVEEKVEELVMGVIEKGQKELEVDFLGFAQHMHANHYKQWKKTEKDWDRGEKNFTKSTIDVTAEVTITATGATDKVKR